jgi:CheY-like chemotaxis protein/anti-sigma regulatory factor (Ser/Thr protein kinase)
MISGVAHELNNPLAVVGGYLELILANHDLPLKTRQDLEKVARESNRATRLVRSFLAVARSQPTRREMVDINDLIDGVIELHKFDLAQAKVRLQTELDHAIAHTGAEPDQLQQVLTILVTNAMQAMAKMTEPRLMKITTALQEGKIQIVVHDNGPGVPPEIEARIFEPFFTTKEVGVGTGLGLSIAHGIMSDHGGQIHYERSPLGGAAFVLELPIVSADALPLVAADTSASTFPGRQTVGPKAEKILVVDDEKAIVELIGEMLSVLGYDAALCSSAGEGLKRIDETQFDVVMSDLRMPEIDGPQFYRLAVEKDPRLKRRFIFLTGDTVNEDSRAFLKKAGQPFLGKPFRLVQIQEAMRQTLPADVSLQ